MTANSADLPRTLFLEDAVFVISGLDSGSIDLPAVDLRSARASAFEGTTKAGVTVEYKDVWRRGATWGALARGGMDAERYEKEPRGSTQEAMMTDCRSFTAAIGL